jgi:hypothetical protein
MMHLLNPRIDRCQKCSSVARGVTFVYDEHGIPSFYCVRCFGARLDDCILAVVAVRSDMAAHAELTRADLAND